MRTVLFLVLAVLLLFPLRAEDWTTTDGKTYKDVKVVRSNPAYVTILHSDGGGQVPLSTLPADLQKRFGYTPAAAAKFIADTAAAVKANKEALANERARVAAQDAAQQEAAAEAFFIALFTLPPDHDVASTNSSGPASSGDSVPPPDYSTTPIASEPPSQIDDWGYGGYGYPGYYYVGYGYGGYRSYRTGTHYGAGYTRAGTRTSSTTPYISTAPRH